MAAFKTGTEKMCPGILTAPIDDNVKYSLKDYRENLYSLFLMARKDKGSPRPSAIIILSAIFLSAIILSAIILSALILSSIILSSIILAVTSVESQVG